MGIRFIYLARLKVATYKSMYRHYPRMTALQVATMMADQQAPYHDDMTPAELQHQYAKRRSIIHRYEYGADHALPSFWFMLVVYSILVPIYTPFYMLSGLVVGPVCMFNNLKENWQLRHGKDPLYAH